MKKVISKFHVICITREAAKQLVEELEVKVEEARAKGVEDSTADRRAAESKGKSKTPRRRKERKSSSEEEEEEEEEEEVVERPKRKGAGKTPVRRNKKVEGSDEEEEEVEEQHSGKKNGGVRRKEEVQVRQDS